MLNFRLKSAADQHECHRITHNTGFLCGCNEEFNNFIQNLFLLVCHTFDFYVTFTRFILDVKSNNKIGAVNLCLRRKIITH